MNELTVKRYFNYKIDIMYKDYPSQSIYNYILLTQIKDRITTTFQFSLNKNNFIKINEGTTPILNLKNEGIYTYSGRNGFHLFNSNGEKIKSISFSNFSWYFTITDYLLKTKLLIFRTFNFDNGHIFKFYDIESENFSKEIDLRGNRALSVYADILPIDDKVYFITKSINETTEMGLFAVYNKEGDEISRKQLLLPDEQYKRLVNGNGFFVYITNSNKAKLISLNGEILSSFEFPGYSMRSGLVMFYTVDEKNIYMLYVNEKTPTLITICSTTGAVAKEEVKIPLTFFKGTPYLAHNVSLYDDKLIYVDRYFCLKTKKAGKIVYPKDFVTKEPEFTVYPNGVFTSFYSNNPRAERYDGVVIGSFDENSLRADLAMEQVPGITKVEVK